MPKFILPRALARVEHDDSFYPAENLSPVQPLPLGEEAREAKRARIEEYAWSYLKGGELIISSAQLTGPFDRTDDTPTATMAKNSQLEKKYKKPKVARAPIASAPITTTQFIAPRPASVQETAAAATASFAHPADAYYRDVQPAQKASTLSWNPYDYYKAYELYVPTQTATPTATSIVPILPSLLPVRSNPTIASTQTTASQPIISQSQPIRTAATTPLTQPSQSNYSKNASAHITPAMVEENDLWTFLAKRTNKVLERPTDRGTILSVALALDATIEPGHTRHRESTESM